MKITILFGGNYSHIINQDKINIEIEKKLSNIDDLLEFLNHKLGINLKYDYEKGQALILINGRNVKTMNEILLNDGDFISILPPVKGG